MTPEKIYVVIDVAMEYQPKKIFYADAFDYHKLRNVYVILPMRSKNNPKFLKIYI